MSAPTSTLAPGARVAESRVPRRSFNHSISIAKPGERNWRKVLEQ